MGDIPTLVPLEQSQSVGTGTPPASGLFHVPFCREETGPITIKGYRSAIARVFRLSGRPDPGADQDLSLR